MYPCLSVLELIRKIYEEGVQKAESESEKILRDAHIKAQEIVDLANAKGKHIIDNAEKRAAELKVHTEAEMRLASRQALSNLQQKIRDMLIWEVTAKPLEEAFDDKEFMKTLIEKLVNFWLEHFGEIEGLDILLPKKDFEEAQDVIRARMQFLLQNKIEIKVDDSLTSGFRISPEHGRFKVSFTPEDFENYFRSFAKPRIFKLLFAEND